MRNEAVQRGSMAPEHLSTLFPDQRGARWDVWV